MTRAPRSLDDLDLAALLRPILTSHATTVAAWRRDEPGAWGALAAQAILAARGALGRTLTEPERRIVWQTMWILLNEG
jgi:hypothetical protein